MKHKIYTLIAFFFLAATSLGAQEKMTVSGIISDQAGVPLIFSVVFGRVKPEELVQWMLESQRSYLRFQLQMHKFIWPPEMRGV